MVATSPRATAVNPIALFAAESGNAMEVDVDGQAVLGVLEEDDESDFEMPPLVLAGAVGFDDGD